MTLAKAKAKTNDTFIVQASSTIVTYDHQNMFIVQATGQLYDVHNKIKISKSFGWAYTFITTLVVFNYI
jgi:hypothetical protein